jgi:hypothetical protein
MTYMEGLVCAEPVQASPRFSCFRLISGHYARPENRGDTPYDCMESLGNIYENGSQTYRPKL